MTPCKSKGSQGTISKLRHKRPKPAQWRVFAFLRGENGARPISPPGRAERAPPFSVPLTCQQLLARPCAGFFISGAPMSTTAKDVAILEVAKMAPIPGSLIVWGLTLQEWTILFGCLYALGLLLDLVVRRWLVPLVRLVRRRGTEEAR